MNDEQAKALGGKVIEFLGIKGEGPRRRGFYFTSFGRKTKTGLGHCIAQIVKDHVFGEPK